MLRLLSHSVSPAQDCATNQPDRVKRVCKGLHGIKYKAFYASSVLKGDGQSLERQLSLLEGCFL